MHTYLSLTSQFPSHQQSQDSVTAFSGGQESFSQFTMDMVRQYMKDEEVRLQHQSSLLHLRQKALKEKTKTELAWLEHQKKRLRDKGEDDKMPPIRKKQRGLLMKLQQEQVHIWQKHNEVIWQITFGYAVPYCAVTRAEQIDQILMSIRIFASTIIKTINVKQLLYHMSQHVGKCWMCIQEQLHCILE